MSNEVTGVIVICIHFCLLFYAIFIKKIKLPFWYYAGTFCFLLGFLALYLSPGHAKRAAFSVTQSTYYYSLGDLWRLSFYEKLKRMSDVLRPRGIMIAAFACFVLLFLYEQYKGKRNMHIAIIVFSAFCVAISSIINFIPHLISSIVFLVVLYYIYNIYKRDCNEYMARIYLHAMLIFAIMDMFLLLTLQVIVGGRAGLFIVLAGIIHCMLLFKAVIYMFPNLERKIYYGILIFTLLFGGFVLSAFVDMHIKWNNMVSYVEEQKSQGVKDIVVSPKYFHSFYSRYGDWDSPSKDINAFPNPVYADYFGVRTFRTQE